MTAHMMKDTLGGGHGAGLSDEQFDELKRLLHPIHHIARHALAELGYEENAHGHWHKPGEPERVERERYEPGQRVWSDGREGTIVTADEAEDDRKLSEGEYHVKTDAGRHEVWHHDDISPVHADRGNFNAGEQANHDREFPNAGEETSAGGQHAPERDPLDAPEDRDPNKMPAEEPQRQYHQAVAEPGYENRTEHTSAEMNEDDARRGEEPEFGGANMEQAELHRQNELLKARPNQGVDQHSLMGGESMQQRAAAEAGTRAVPRATAERPAETGPSTIAKDPAGVE